MSFSASEFSNWVYHLRHPNKIESVKDQRLHYRRMLGSLDHEVVDLMKQRTLRMASPRIKIGNWDLCYADTGADDRFFQSTYLTIDGTPMKGRPDVIFEYKHDNYFIVVERTFTSVPREKQHDHIFEPAQIQLWVYSWLDIFSEAIDVLLILEIWERHRGGIQTGDIVSWRRSDEKHHFHCLELFERYAARKRRF